MLHVDRLITMIIYDYHTAAWCPKQRCKKADNPYQFDGDCDVLYAPPPLSPSLVTFLHIISWPGDGRCLPLKTRISANFAPIIHDTVILCMHTDTVYHELSCFTDWRPRGLAAPRTRGPESLRMRFVVENDRLTVAVPTGNSSSLLTADENTGNIAHLSGEVASVMRESWEDRSPWRRWRIFHSLSKSAGATPRMAATLVKSADSGFSGKILCIWNSHRHSQISQCIVQV